MPRDDTRDKVRGAAIYLEDMKLQGMLYGKVLRSRCSHARVLRVDVSRAEALHGVVTGIDLPYLHGESLVDEPFLASPMHFMKLRWLKSLTIVLPFLFLVVLELLRHSYLEPMFRSWVGLLIVGSGIGGGLFAFSHVVFGLIARVQREVIQQNRRLQVLNEIGIDLAGELSLDALLQKVVDFSRILVEARYGAMHVLKDDGQTLYFLTSGLDPEMMALVGPPPARAGVLGLLLNGGKAIRLSDIAAHPSAAGFPPHHPPMKSFLGVPIISKGAVIGSLYLTDKEGGQEFIQADQDAITMLAAQAAVAIENARLYERLRGLTALEERQRIAMDLHDGVIQSIYGVGLNLEVCADLIGGHHPEVKGRMAHAVDTLNDVIQEVRNYIFDLRPDRFDTKTMRQVLEEVIEELRFNAPIEAELVIDGVEEELSHEQILQLSHIVRETTANIVKHAKASSAVIRFAPEDSRLVLSVRDDGVGFAQGQDGAMTGQGLKNMEQRAGILGGCLFVKSAPGNGTEVTVTIPTIRRRRASNGQDKALDRR